MRRQMYRQGRRRRESRITLAIVVYMDGTGRGTLEDADVDADLR